MDVVLIELILWAGLIFLFWMLKDGLGRVESTIEALAPTRERAARTAPRTPAYVQPDRVLEPIGSYREATIYRYALIGGKRYCFDHILPADVTPHAAPGEYCLAPGLVYVECGRPAAA